jgi:hypothetical protein
VIRRATENVPRRSRVFDLPAKSAGNYPFLMIVR